MNYAYRECYLNDAMRNLGEMTEYAHDACNINPEKALRYFVISGYANRFEQGDPGVVCGLSGTELLQRAAEKCGEVKEWPPAIVKYSTEEYYWIGYILAYFQWSINRSFGSILDTVSPDDLLNMYPALHTASEERAVSSIADLYRSRTQAGRLQEYRKRMAMTQAELAKVSKVNIRTLQQYEAGSKSINKAAAETVIALAYALHCRPEELIS